MPTPAGTSPDSIGRLLADRLSRALGQSVVAENITGAGGLIASRTAAKAAPDGYTLYFSGTGALITDRYTQKNLGYDPDRDFTLIAMIYEEGSLALAVHPEVPVKTLPDLIALARQQPGKVSYGTTSVSLLILFGQWITRLAGIDMLAVPYKAASFAWPAMLAGEVQASYFALTSAAVAMVKSGKARTLAVTLEKRLPELPDVPTYKEAGIEFPLVTWFGLCGPKGTPREIVVKLNREINAGLAHPAMRAKLAELGHIVFGGAPADFSDFISQEITKWAKVIRAAGITTD